jgi:hypothetical protein
MKRKRKPQWRRRAAKLIVLLVPLLWPTLAW